MKESGDGELISHRGSRARDGDFYHPSLSQFFELNDMFERPSAFFCVYRLSIPSELLIAFSVN